MWCACACGVRCVRMCMRMCVWYDVCVHDVTRMFMCTYACALSLCLHFVCGGVTSVILNYTSVILNYTSVMLNYTSVMLNYTCVIWPVSHAECARLSVPDCVCQTACARLSVPG